MEFFSGLKKAYDSLGTEISKTFDSSTGETEEHEAAQSPTPEQFQEQSSVTETGSHREGEGGDGWGEWEETGPKLLAGSRNKLVAQSTKSKGMKLQGQPGGVREKQQPPDQRVGEGDHQGTMAPVESHRTPVVPQVQSPESGGGEGTKSPPVVPQVQSPESGGGEGTKSPLVVPQVQSPESGGGEGTKSPPLATSTPAKPAGKTQLDSLSREDLVKYVKRQAQLLQKTKARCDELTKECDRVKASSSLKAAPDSLGSEALLEELQVVRGERDRAVEEGKSLKQATTALEKDKKHLAAKLQSLEGEVATLKQSFQQLRQSSASREEDLRCQLEVSGTKLSAVQQLRRSEEEDTHKLVESLKEELKQSNNLQSDLESQLAVARARDEPDLAEERDRVLSEAASLRDELQMLRQEARRREGSLEEEKEGLLQKLREGERKHEEGKRKVEDLREQLKAGKQRSKEEVSGLQREKETLATEVDGLKAALESTKQQVHLEMEARLALAEEQLSSADMAREREELRGEKARLETRVRELETQVQSQQCELDEVCEERESLQHAAESVRQDRKLIQSRVDDTIEQVRTLESELHAVQSEKAELCSQLEEVQSHSMARQQELESLRGERSGLESQLSKMMLMVQSQKAELQEVRREGESVTAQLVQLEDSHRAESASLREENETLRARKEQVTGELQSLREQLEAVRGERDAGDLSELQSLREQLEAVRGERDAGDSELQSLREQLEAVRGERDAGDSELQSLREQLEAVRGERDTGDLSELQSLREQLEAARGERDAGDLSELQSLREQLEAVRGERDARDLSELQSLREQLEAVRGERDAGDSELQSLREQLEAVRGERDAGDSELQSLREQLEVVRGERDAVKLLAEEKAAAHKGESKKLKAFIVKIKKELSETKERVSKEASLKHKLDGVEGAGMELGELREQLQSALEEREKLRVQMDQTAASMQAEKQSVIGSGAKMVQELEGQLEVVRSELVAVQVREAESLESLSSERDVLSSRVRELEEAQEVLHSELATAQSDLATASSQTNTHSMTTERVQLELQGVREEMEREKERHVETRQKLAAAEKEAKASTLMDLELADYQRSMKSLEGELSSQEEQLQEARRASKTQLEAAQLLRKDLESLSQQRTQSDEKVTKMKALLVKSKKELAEAKRQESELQGTITDLHSQLEAEKQHSELAKVEISELTARLLAAQQQSDSSVEMLQRTIRTLELKVGSIQSELSSTQAALSESQLEYENYKVRVHSVLKQKSNGPNSAEMNSELKQKYESELSTLRAELKETKHQLSSALLDHEELLVDHDQLSGRHNQLLQEASGDRDQWQRKFQEEESRHSALTQEQSELIYQLRQEALEVTSAFKTQLHGLQEDHQCVMEGLKEEVQAAQREVSRLQQEADTRVLARAAAVQEGGGGPGREQQVPETKPPLPPKEQRSAGEGMDQAELDSNTNFPATPLSREDSQVSFERLLSMASTADLPPAEGELHKQLHAASRRIEHLTEVLRESEANSMRLGDQAKLLKEEIRRLERNQEREQDVSNMEYLKNVVLKFLHTAGPEQASLLPVITKLLRLSPQEVKFLKETLKGNPSELPSAGGATPTSPASKGWSTYIHRWTGH